MKKIIDISVPLSPELPVWPGDQNVEIVQGYAKRPLSGAKKRIHLRFLTSPTGIAADRNGRISL